MDTFTYTTQLTTALCIDEYDAACLDLRPLASGTVAVVGKGGVVEALITADLANTLTEWNRQLVAQARSEMEAEIAFEVALYGDAA